MLTKVKMKKENNQIPTVSMLSSPVSAILVSALFTCKARSDWLVCVPLRLFCEGKEACVEKDYRLVVPLVFLRRKKRKRRSNFRQKCYRFFFFFFFRKSVFCSCTWNISIVLDVRYQNALFCAHEMLRHPAVD